MSQSAPAQVIIVQSAKSPGLAAVLALIFGPIGLLYSTVKGSIVMFFVNVLVGALTVGFGLLLTWPICAIWGYRAAQAHNERLAQAGSAR